MKHTTILVQSGDKRRSLRAVTYPEGTRQECNLSTTSSTFRSVLDFARKYLVGVIPAVCLPLKQIRTFARIGFGMSKRTIPSSDFQEHLSCPSGTPAWITPELLTDTITTWQPYYADELTIYDALEILLGVGNLIDVLEHVDDETIPGAGEGVKP